MVTLHRSIKTVLVVLAIVLALESLSRIVFRDEMLSMFSQGFHPDIGFTLSGDVIKVKRLPARNMWPQTIPAHKATDTTRVFVIGSSVSRGTRNANYPFLLRDRYQDKRLPNSRHRLELYNLSASGYGIRRKQALFERALRLQPDLIMIHLDGSNEFEDERESNTANQYQGYSRPAEWPMKLWHFRFFAQRRTEKLVWRYLPREARKDTVANDADLELASSNDAASQARWRQRLDEHIGQMAERANASGVPLVFIIRGEYNAGHLEKARRVKPGDFEDDLSRFLLKTAQKYRNPRVRIIRLGQVFSGAGLPPHEYAPLFADSVHLSLAGHRVVAGYLDKAVLASL